MTSIHLCRIVYRETVRNLLGCRAYNISKHAAAFCDKIGGEAFGRSIENDGSAVVIKIHFFGCFI